MEIELKKGFFSFLFFLSKSTQESLLCPSGPLYPRSECFLGLKSTCPNFSGKKEGGKRAHEFLPLPPPSSLPPPPRLRHLFIEKSWALGLRPSLPRVNFFKICLPLSFFPSDFSFKPPLAVSISKNLSVDLRLSLPSLSSGRPHLLGILSSRSLLCSSA